MEPIDSTDPELTAAVRQVMREIRAQAQREEATDAVDRILAAATFVFAALSIVWPRDRKTPTIAAVLVNLGRHLWRRRHWWMP